MSEQHLGPHRYQPGESGNPRGRPRHALAYAIRRITNPDEIARFAYDVFSSPRRSIKLRVWAAEFLADRGWGRPVQQVELDAAIGQVTVSAGFDLGQLSADQRKALFDLLRQARALTDGGGNSGGGDENPTGGV